MAFTALESLAPSSTFLSLPQKPEDPKSRALRAFLGRGESPPDSAVLAPELAILGTRSQGLPRMRRSIDALHPVESFEDNGGEMVHYRITQGNRTVYRLAGWTSDGKLFWLQ
jgi:hypothetical protein